jgi:hypothetical protein
MMATAETGIRKEEGPVLETGGTANLTTAAPNGRRWRRISVAMSAGRKIAYVAGGGLLVAWIAAANMPSHDADRASERGRSTPAVSPSAIAEDVDSQAARLQARMAHAPVPENNPRNPFAFGMTPRPSRVAQPVAAATVEAAPAVVVPPPPALTLMGIAEEYVIGGYRRTAVIGGDGDAVFIVAEGDSVGDRYKVTKIGADAVELEDLVNKGYRRLALR